MIRAILVSVATLVATPSMAVSPLTEADAALLQQGLVTTADEFILPAYVAQQEAATELSMRLEAFCATGADLAAAQTAFADMFLAWQRASVVGFGPIMDAEGPMRVQLWPDPKGFSARAVRGAIRTEDAALLTPGGLVGRSIALTNLTALEGLLFRDVAPNTYACDLATAIARFQRDLAIELVHDWTPGSAYREDHDSAAIGNARYATVDALIREVLAGATVYTDRLRKFKIERGAGADAGQARPERSEARLSALGRQSIETSFRALSDLYDVPFGLFDAAPDIGGSMEYVILGETARNVADALAVDPATLEDILTEDGASAAELRRFASLVLFHETFLKTGFPSSLGLVSGFTSADGD